MIMLDLRERLKKIDKTCFRRWRASDPKLLIQRQIKESSVITLLHMGKVNHLKWSWTGRDRRSEILRLRKQF
jgi:hypothetical protein